MTRRQGVDGRIGSLGRWAAAGAAVVLLVLVVPAVGASVAEATVPAPAAGVGLDGLHDLTAGTFHTCAITASGGVRCWGANGNGQLGDGTTVSRSTPVDVIGLGSGVVEVSAGYTSTSAVLSSGGLKCWGGNDYGELGDGTTTQHTTPIDIPGLTTGVRSVSIAGYGGCVVTTAGGAKCWGLNYWGEVGDGTQTTRPTAVNVQGLTSGVASLSFGGIHGCAVTVAGAAKCWGINQRGEVGDGTRTMRTSPVDVTGLSSGVASISAHQIESCAVTTGGAAKCWGYNDTGKLGDGTTTMRTTPVAVVGLSSGVASIEVGDYHTCGLMASGAAKCWGENFAGMVGDGTTTTRLVPTDVVGLGSGVVEMAAGGVQSCARTAAPGIRCWGANQYGGAVGDGTAINRPAPVDVSGSFYRPECPTLVAADHSGFAMTDGYGAGSVATFAADPGWKLVGSAALTCQTSLAWSGTPPLAVPAPESIKVVPGIGAGNELDIEERDLPVPVTLSIPAPGPVTVEWTTLFVSGAPGDQATPGADYVPVSGTVTFAAGQTTAYVHVSILPDGLVEGDEYVVVSFHDPTGAVMGGYWGLGFGRIHDNDIATVVPGAGQVVEGDAGTTTVQVPVTLTKPSTHPITVAFTTLVVTGAPAGQATAGDDYVPVSGTVTFQPGETSATVSVTLVGDTVAEPDEYVVVSFHDPVGAIMGGFWGLGFGQILDDD